MEESKLMDYTVFRTTFIRLLKNLLKTAEKLEETFKDLNENTKKMEKDQSEIMHTLSEIKNIQTLNCRPPYPKSQNKDLEYEEEKNTQPERRKERRIQKCNDNVRSLWDGFKRTNIRIFGVPEEEKEQDIENLFEEIMTENFPHLTQVHDATCTSATAQIEVIPCKIVVISRLGSTMESSLYETSFKCFIAIHPGWKGMNPCGTQSWQEPRSALRRGGQGGAEEEREPEGGLSSGMGWEDGLIVEEGQCGPYVHDITRKVTNRKVKEADDVLGGAAAGRTCSRLQSHVPNVNILCLFHQLQTRAADKPMTTFYKCCDDQRGHRWETWARLAQLPSEQETQGRRRCGENMATELWSLRREEEDMGTLGRGQRLQ
ncbi:hypothetical protein QTO34_013055 [Cnephaeus nilssonii]|uniref:TFIIS-type domain-containing protein n=1 Tax=Cnephaeus nilssonii TaxID=3371016 RepID=A0AA40LDJ1_CNENI|nr:hypothetical protein QTO34_013055 [Eptesicus nilssonii]